MRLTPPLWPQWLAGLTVTVLTTSMGMAVGWTSPYLAQLTSEDSVFKVTDDEASWIASLLALGRLFGAIFGALLVEFVGSKTSLLMSGIPFTIGWLGIIFASSINWLYMARTASGIGTGMVFSSFALYMGEISAPNIRGALVGLVINGIPLGTLTGNLMGPYMPMMWFGIISLVLDVAFMIAFPFLPQSAHYYARHNDMISAEKSLQWYYQKSDVTFELSAVEKFVKGSAPVSFYERLKQMGEPKNRRAFSIIVLLFTFMQLSGLNTVVFYMEIILRKAEINIIAPSNIVVTVNTLGIIVAWLGLYLIDRSGRRKMLAVSTCSLMISMAILGLHFQLLDLGFDAQNFQWLPIISLLIFTLVYVGLSPIPSTLLSELFPVDLKSVAGFVASLTSAVMAFTASRTYQPLVDLMGDQYVFWTYSILMVACLIYTLLDVPETKGKTLQEIQAMLAGENPLEKSKPIENGNPPA